MAWAGGEKLLDFWSFILSRFFVSFPYRLILQPFPLLKWPGGFSFGYTKI